MSDLEPQPEALVYAAVGGDRRAFETLLRHHYDRIHALAWQLTGSRADADDIAQEVCCTLVEKLHSFRGDAKFTTWLCGIVYNACRDMRRQFGGQFFAAQRLAALFQLDFRQLNFLSLGGQFGF